LGPTELGRRIIAAVSKHESGGPPADDRAMVCIGRLPVSEEEEVVEEGFCCRTCAASGFNHPIRGASCRYTREGTS
jgi:hypothetical protein